MLNLQRNERSRFSWIVAVLLLTMPVTGAADFNLRMQTDLGSFDIVMLDAVAPLTVANFMNYVNRGDYNGTFLHRSVPGFVLQGGGFVFDSAQGSFFGGGTTLIPVDPPVVNEFNLSNLPGTIAMAKVGTDPDSATSQFFFNLADNSGSPPDGLDFQNGGFTVFARVLGKGMDVIDAIELLPTCPQVAPFLCTPVFSTELPLADNSGIFDNSTLINIAIGLDNDGDGVIDKLEDLAPNGGDGDDDGTPDSLQQHVASYRTEAGSTVVVKSLPINPLQGFNALGAAFGLVNIPTLTSPDGFVRILIEGRAFEDGFAGYDVTGLVQGGTIDIVITLPGGAQPNAFYNFGPEPGNMTPHWYEFSFDGTTGAIYNNNQITLRFVDGLRGDSDLNTNNGIIVAAPGGAVNNQVDLDGVDATVEDAAPPGNIMSVIGDSNGDGILDSLQGNVTSLPDINESALDPVTDFYVSLVAMPPATFHLVSSLDSFDLAFAFVQEVPGLEGLAGLNFKNGFFSIVLGNIGAGGSTEFTLTLPAGDTADTYFKFGPEPGNTVPHWYEFMFDAASGTGAVINGNVITLHLVDGQRGDTDLDATNGLMLDPGGPATRIGNANAQNNSGGGCVMLDSVGMPSKAGAWWLLLLLGAVYTAQRRRKEPD